MNRLQLICAALAVLLQAASAGEVTALRTGLWELDFKSDLSVEQARQLSARIPDVLFANIPAAQRSDLKRLYESGELLRNALNGTDTLCITEEDLERGIRPATDIDESCAVSEVRAHASSQQLQLMCTGLVNEQPAAAAIDITVQDAHIFTGNITRIVAGAVKPFTIKVELHGKWLDSQCGEEALEEDEGD